MSRCAKEMDVQAIHILNPILINGLSFYNSKIHFQLIFILTIIL